MDINATDGLINDMEKVNEEYKKKKEEMSNHLAEDLFTQEDSVQ